MATEDLASFSQGSEEVYTLVCLPCHRDDTKRPAQGYCTDCKEHLCQECVIHHKKPAPCRHHKLQGKDTMPSTQCLTGTPVHTCSNDNLATVDQNLASFSQGSDEDYTLVCVPCHRDDITRHAQCYCIECTEHLCHECSIQHRKATPSRHHKLQGKDTMPSTQLLASVDGTITPTCQGEIYVKSSKDSKRCWITGMTVFPPDRLVLADQLNNSIKLVDVNSKSIISHLSLDTWLDTHAPWEIISTTCTEVAVTVPGSRRIQFISVRKSFLSLSDKLSKSHTIQTYGKCYGICCHQDKLIVIYRDPGKLEILDMRGRVITRATTDSTGTDIFTGPEYVQANSRSIYVSDWKTNSVIMLNWNGEITGRITDIGDPRGLALLHDGSLLVCGWVHDRVHQVAGDGTNSRIILQDVRHPDAACVDDGGHEIYISRLTLIEDTLSLANNILIYNI